MLKYDYREIADLGIRQKRLLDPSSAPAITVFGRIDVLAAATSGAPPTSSRTHPPSTRERDREM